MNQIKTQLPASSLKSLQLLGKGNQRFVKGTRSVDMTFSTEKLKELAEKGQSPFSIVLACADSRVPVETIFDLGLGDIFVIRVAGNVISPDIIASVEYAATQFGTPLCVVMGHTGCGAVQAAIQYAESGECTLSGYGKGLLRKILPSVKKAIRVSHLTHDSLAKFATLVNIQRNKSLLIRNSKVLTSLITHDKFAIVGAIYNLHTGVVTFDQEDQYHSIPEPDPIFRGPSRAVLVG